jgi:hypothetical protein
VRVRTNGGELKLFTLPNAVVARLDSPVLLRNSRLDQAVAGLRTGVVVDCAVGPKTSNRSSDALNEGLHPPSSWHARLTTASRAQRRKYGLLSPIGAASTPARSCAGYTIDLALQGRWAEGLGRVWRPRRISGQRAARLPEGRRQEVTSPGRSLPKRSSEPVTRVVEVGYRLAADSSLQANEQGTGHGPTVVFHPARSEQGK